jgi:hypothetical protein
VNQGDGRYAPECWLDPDSLGDPDDNEFSDDLDETVERAKALISAGDSSTLLSVNGIGSGDNDGRDLYTLPEEIDRLPKAGD